MPIEIEIDRIVLDGFKMPHRERPLLETAVRAELTRLLAENGLSYQANIAYRHVIGPDIPQSGQHNTTQLGQAIARSVYGGLT